MALLYKFDGTLDTSLGVVHSSFLSTFSFPLGAGRAVQVQNGKLVVNMMRRSVKVTAEGTLDQKIQKKNIPSVARRWFVYFSLSGRSWKDLLQTGARATDCKLEAGVSDTQERRDERTSS